MSALECRVRYAEHFASKLQALLLCLIIWTIGADGIGVGSYGD